MKRVKLNSLLKMTLTLSLILGLGLMVGCSDDDSTGPEVDDPFIDGTITGSLDGVPFTYNESVFGSNVNVVDERTIVGSGTGAGEAFLMNVSKVVGTYTILNGSIASIQMSDGVTGWTCVSGAVVVSTSTNTRITGSFTGTFEDQENNTLLVTNGAFDVPVSLVQ